MTFIDDILNYDSLSIVGLQKNTGKTVSLNYVLDRLPVERKRIAVTSIGIDGETTDQVTRTQKPEIYLRQGMYFGTSEMHYRQKRIVSELIDVSDENTSLGRVVTAKALTGGKILLSGPSSSSGLKRWMKDMHRVGIELVIIDGALSRMSLASPAVSQSMILATGAAYSTNMNTLVQQTAFVVDLIKIPLTEEANLKLLMPIEKGVWYIDDEGALHELSHISSLSQDFRFEGMDRFKTLYVAGASLSEGSPQVIKEAMACGCPIVSLDVGDVRERMEGVEGCYVAMMRKPEELAMLLQKAIGFQGKTRGREKVMADGLENDKVASELVRIYERVTKK